MTNINCLFLLSCFLLACNPTTEEKEISAIKPSDFSTLFHPEMKEGVACYRIPALITAANGDLLAAVDERHNNCGDLRSNDNINIVLRRSRDQGRSWSDMETLIDYPPGESASDPSFILDQKTGNLFMFFNYMNLRTQKDIYYFRVIKSKDHGQTWSEALDITAQICPPDWQQDFKFITSGRGAQTQNGLLVHTLVNLEKGLHLFASANQGKDWYLINTPLQPGDESKFLELSDGSWMINSRVNKAGHRYVHRSVDQGKSWNTKPATDLPDPGCNGSLLLYPSGQKDQPDYLLFSNPNSPDKRENLSIRGSTDGGQTWPFIKTIYSGAAAYSSLSPLKDQQIGLLFEKDDYQEISFIRFPLQWVLTKAE